MCKDAGIEGFHTNHSLRATTATRLYSAGADEQLIMELTGHRSVSGVRSYKCTSGEQEQVVSDILGQSKRCKTNTPPLDSLPTPLMSSPSLSTVPQSVSLPQPSTSPPMCPLPVLSTSSCPLPKSQSSMQQRTSTMEAGCHVPSPGLGVSTNAMNSDTVPCMPGAFYSHSCNSVVINIHNK